MDTFIKLLLSLIQDNHIDRLRILHMYRTEFNSYSIERILKLICNSFTNRHERPLTTHEEAEEEEKCLLASKTP